MTVFSDGSNHLSTSSVIINNCNVTWTGTALMLRVSSLILILFIEPLSLHPDCVGLNANGSLDCFKCRSEQDTSFHCVRSCHFLQRVLPSHPPPPPRGFIQFKLTTRSCVPARDTAKNCGVGDSLLKEVSMEHGRRIQLIKGKKKCFSRKMKHWVTNVVVLYI